jgi:tetratricopeptide (TPR) repeat protein
MIRRFLVALSWVALVAAGQPALAADSAPPPKPDAASPLAAARALIAEKNWPAAIAELKKADQPGNADWNNLMGYSLRKSATPDYAAAEKHYDEALRIDPKHRGALEYSGELYLILGNLAKAEQRLAALDKACTFGCEEYTDLKQAVQRYKANGNKVVDAR